jgi:hypothetical protein
MAFLSPAPDLCAGGSFKIDRPALYGPDRPPEQRTEAPAFVDMGRQRHAADEGNGGFHPERQRAIAGIAVDLVIVRPFSHQSRTNLGTADHFSDPIVRRLARMERRRGQQMQLEGVEGPVERAARVAAVITA